MTPPPFGSFPKKHPVWTIQTSLMKVQMERIGRVAFVHWSPGLQSSSSSKKKWPGKLRTYAPLRQKETKRRKRRNNHHYPAHTLQRPLSSSSENTKILNQTFNAVSHISKSTISEPKSYPFNWKCDIVIEILWEECSSFRGITSNFTAEILRLI